MSGNQISRMKVWKPFERWTNVMGNRVEHKWHSDFSMTWRELLSYCLPDELMNECPPVGKIYKVHVSISLEEFDEQD